MSRASKLIEKRGPFRIYKTPGAFGPHFYWTIVAANYRVLATSEMYRNKANAVKGIRATTLAAASYPRGKI